MKSLILIISVFIFGLTPNQPKHDGLEIFLVHKPCPDFTKKDNPECYYCLDLKSEDLYEQAFLTENDIKEFDYENQTIEFTENAKLKLKELNIPLQGLAAAMVLNGEIIYGFWFWNVFSSFGCDRVYTYPKLDFKIKFGLPNSNTFGNDPRFDSRLKKYLSDKKRM